MSNAKIKIMLSFIMLALMTACNLKDKNANSDEPNTLLVALDKNEQDEMDKLTQKTYDSLTVDEKAKASKIIKDYFIKNKIYITDVINKMNVFEDTKADFDSFLSNIERKSEKAFADFTSIQNSLSVYNDMLPALQLEKQIKDLWSQFSNDENYDHVRTISQKLNLNITEKNIKEMQDSDNSVNNKDQVYLTIKPPYRHENRNEVVNLRDLIQGTLYKQKIIILLKKYNLKDDLKISSIIDFRKKDHLEQFTLSTNKYNYKNYKELYDDNSIFF